LFAGLIHTYSTEVWEMENGSGVSERALWSENKKKRAVAFFFLLSERYFRILNRNRENKMSKECTKALEVHTATPPHHPPSPPSIIASFLCVYSPIAIFFFFFFFFFVKFKIGLFFLSDWLPFLVG
jgi:hypothetical protein